MYRRIVLLTAATTALAAVVPAMLSGEARVGALVGVLTAAVSSAVALILFKISSSKGIQQALAGQVIGFLGRMLLVAAGLLVSKAVSGDLLWFAGLFFALFFTHQTIEITALMRLAAQQSGSPALGSKG